MMIHLFEILASLAESALGIAVPAKLLGEKRSGGIRLAAVAAVLTAVVSTSTCCFLPGQRYLEFY